MDVESDLETSGTARAAAADAVRAAVVRLILGRDAAGAFFAVLALRLRTAPDEKCSTMATDGRDLVYSPAFVLGLSADELVGVVAHEVLHVALAHPFRRGTRDPGRWNIACDLAANPLLLEAGFTLPRSRLVPGEGAYNALPAGRTADEYYVLLPDAEENPSDCLDPGGCGAALDPAPGDEASAADVAADCRAAVVQAERAAAGRGDLPGGLRRAVEDVARQPADWRAVLRAFVTARARNDYSWSRPNRRFLAQGLYLPGLYSEELGEVLVAVDTSGSISPQELGVFAREVNAILESHACIITVWYHDTRVRHEVRRESSDGPLVLEPVGGGGTSHVEVFARVATLPLPPACVICLTDLDTRFPDAVPDVPVLWAVVGGNRATPPFGCRIDVED